MTVTGESAGAPTAPVVAAAAPGSAPLCDIRPLVSAVDPAAAKAWGDAYRAALPPNAWRDLLVRSFGAGELGDDSSEHDVHRYRIASFAAANGLEYVPRVVSPPLPGVIFAQGMSRVVDEAVRSTSPRFVEYGNFSFSMEDDGARIPSRLHRWGYVAIRLTSPLPNIVLDATANGPLPALLARGQRLSLEGDFDASFSLYCPSGYEADALYLFTPDVMARFIDSASAFDVEIVDDWLFLYCAGGFDLESPSTWRRLFGVVAVVTERLDGWARWRDERVAAAPTAPVVGVAASGSRLRGRLPVGVLVAAGAGLAGFAAMILYVMISALSALHR